MWGGVNEKVLEHHKQHIKGMTFEISYFTSRGNDSGERNCTIMALVLLLLLPLPVLTQQYQRSGRAVAGGGVINASMQCLI